ncbi:hypothetical protein BBO99_00007686 [Phytophthora kernoviae]|uniref:Rab-GAP TBC domain-containing protein n=1 Tax=Phytophthora kernoviae TaxID=325452 RepID=A0A421GH14_9STRA|nr:hypothetical protein JM16_007359 [Phytophthora kernoviae]KAG2520077.1 hypothetical protein JM18_007254 [Phytophthora kernoviae]RLN76278.1 hypothetical protein BBO99_00007686 [Phytophthora kernoviae]
MELCYSDTMSFEERAALLTDRLMALDQVKEWKHTVEMELAQPEYLVNTALEGPLVVCLLEKLGILGLLKRTVIDLHCEAMQTVAAASKEKAKSSTDIFHLLPDTKTNGCNLDVVQAARDNWEKITSDEMLKLAKEMNRPLVALNKNTEYLGTESTTRTNGLPTGPETEGTKPSKPSKTLAARFLYDGNDLLHSLQAIEPFNRVRDPADTTIDAWVPPNGVLPFSGLVMYMAPLAYVYADPVEIYFVFRELYVRYWSKLNAIRTERGTMLPLCKLFEELIVRSSPTTVFHLINIGIKPLDIAFPWIQSAFSGVLDIDQVLLLWDRVISYDSLEIVAIFAAALFHFRANELELITTRDEADEVFAELIDIQVVTLLQDYLFSLP